jgi:hypothetical protein
VGTTRQDNRWVLRRGDAERPAAAVELDGDTLWRLCARDITPDEARARVRAHGERPLTEQVLRIVSIVR